MKKNLLVTISFAIAMMIALPSFAQELNKISEEDKDALTKNSEADLDVNSNSGSAENLE